MKEKNRRFYLVEIEFVSGKKETVLYRNVDPYSQEDIWDVLKYDFKNEWTGHIHGCWKLSCSNGITECACNTSECWVRTFICLDKVESVTELGLSDITFEFR